MEINLLNDIQKNSTLTSPSIPSLSGNYNGQQTFEILSNVNPKEINLTENKLNKEIRNSKIITQNLNSGIAMSGKWMKTLDFLSK